MEPEFITYQKFDDLALANALAEQLDSHQIKYVIVEESFSFDPSFAMNNALKEYAVKIRSEDFEQANQLLKQDEEIEVTEIGKDYYLFTFTDDELMEVIARADEWSPFDFVLARKILAERSKAMTDDTIAAIEEQRIEELKVPEPPQTLWIIIGYIFAALGGVLGIFVGWHIANYKKTLPDGERVYEYSDSDRRHGKIIFYIAIVVTAIAVIYKVIPVFEDNY